MIAAAMLEEVADASWEDLMRREVFEPLGMTRAGFGAPGTPEALDQPLGHVRGSDGWSPILLGPNADNPAASGPAGTIHATLGDWGRFVAAHLRGGRGDQSYLSSATWRRLHAPGGPDWEYAPGWVVSEAPWAGGRLLRHLGSNGFWVAEASVAPERGIAVLIVTNVGDDAAEAAFKELLAVLSSSEIAPGR
jgi:CubicO group peptidase (beta-lactamase class C family)